MSCRVDVNEEPACSHRGRELTERRAACKGRDVLVGQDGVVDPPAVDVPAGLMKAGQVEHDVPRGALAAAVDVRLGDSHAVAHVQSEPGFSDALVEVDSKATGGECTGSFARLDEERRTTQGAKPPRSRFWTGVLDTSTGSI